MSRGPSRDNIQPDTIARLGLTPTSVERRIPYGRSAGLGTTSRPIFGRGTSVFTAGPGQQRVTVKIHLVRHHTPQQGRDSLSRHARYIGRDGVSRNQERGVFYDAERQAVDIRALPRTWAEDRHHFRVIISPERGQDLADLSTYTREVMQRVEGDLGTRLEWAAVNHFNTDNPHVHVLLRGRDERQQDLVINRDYIRHGWRGRAQEVATELLGERTINHAREGLRNQVHAERWTDLDRALERLSTPGKLARKLDLSKLTLRPGAAMDAEMLHGRLQVLEGLGLAAVESDKRNFGRVRSEYQSRKWHLHPEFSSALKDLGERNDVIKQIHAAMGRDARNIAPQVERLRSGLVPSSGVRGSRQVLQRPQRVVGVVLAKGPVDELTDRRFVVVQDIHASVTRPVHAVVQASPEFDRAALGYVVRLASTQRRESHLSIQASHGLDEQVSAQAWTWLDRQLYRHIQHHKGPTMTWSPGMIRALNARADWLVTHGYAGHSTQELSHESLRFRPGARNALQRAELNASMPEASLLKPGQVVSGRYIATARLHLGTVVVLDRPEGAVVVPVYREPQSLEHGSTVRAEISSNRRVELEVLASASEQQPNSRAHDFPGQDDDLELGGGR